MRILGRCLTCLLVMLCLLGIHSSAQTPAFTTREPVASTGGAGLQILAVVPVMTQDFPNDAMPPAHWETLSYSSGTARKWSTVSAEQFPDYVHSGPYAAWVNYSSEAQDEWLFSSPFRVPVDDQDVALSFWVLTSTNYPTATVTVYIQAGSVTTSVWRLADQSWPSLKYRQVSLNLADYAGQTVRVIWRYHGVEGESLGLDQIVVLGKKEAVFIPLALKD
ncbi:MAG: hypothetical protein GXY52_09720 [Chloroflexi bacterium]|nr:hypothetical protein [Chloroflexota bacterium]